MKHFMISIPLDVDKKQGKIKYKYPKWMSAKIKKDMKNLSCTMLSEIDVTVFYSTDDVKEIALIEEQFGTIEKTEEFYINWQAVKQAELDLKQELINNPEE